MGRERHLNHMRISLLLVLAAIVSGSAVAADVTGAANAGQTAAAEKNWTLNFPVGEFHDMQRDSGRLANQTRGPAVLYEETISVADAIWIRLYFDHAALDTGSFLRITSALDGEVQTLDASGLTLWHNTSAYFNGDTVYLELVGAPDSRGNQVVLDHVGVQMPPADRGPCAPDDCGICDGDDRVASIELWSCRLMPVGCTASVYNSHSCLVSAGHCASEGLDYVAQFNVPLSDSWCNPQNPPVSDQFPITAHLYLNAGVGSDWAVMTTGANDVGQTCFERYGQYREIAVGSVPAGTPCSIWGYGADNDTPTRSQAQQYSTGDITVRESIYYTYDADTTYGDSGSGLINPNNNTIVGIVTHCGLYCDNKATRMDRQDFVDARELLCPTSSFCTATSTSHTPEYISRVVLGSISQSSSGDGYHDYTTLSTSMHIGTGYTITVTLGSGQTGDIGGLWVDWNQDKDFTDTGETITTAWSGAGPYTTTITPPAGASYGYCRMRVRVQRASENPALDPCGDTTHGEVEDYSIRITPITDTDPPSPNPMTFAAPPSPAGTTQIAMLATTATDATPPVLYEFDFISGGAGGNSSGWQYSTSYTDTGLLANTLYTYHVRARDSASVIHITTPSADFTTATEIETPEAVGFGPITLTTIPLVGYTSFTGLTTGQSGLYFDSPTTGGNGGINEWVASTTDTATGLTPNTMYSFRVKARNQLAYETDYCPSQSGTTLIETPTGVTFGAITASTIALNAGGTFTNLTAGSSGLYFDSTTAGGDGGLNEWVQVTSDTATGLNPNARYTFRVMARNQEGIATAWCASASATTLPNTPAAPTLSNPTTATMSLDVNAAANPAATEFAIACTATTDAAWNGKFVSAAGTPVAAEVWQTDATWGTLTVQSLQPGTAYTFAVKARNSAGAQTPLGPGATLSTLGGEGACCAATGACSVDSAADCSAAGGAYMGDGTTCEPAPCCAGQLVGDANCDDAVNTFDIDPFVLALTQPATWMSTYQTAGCSYLCANDCNGDGVVNTFDIDPFVRILTGGGK